MRKRNIGAVFALLLIAAAVMIWGEVERSLKPAARPAAQLEEDDQSAPEGLSAAKEKETTPSEEAVLAARERALEGMTPEQVQRLTEVVTAANSWWEHHYLSGNIFEKLKDPDSLTWNYFDQTGEIQIGWALNSETAENEESIRAEEGLTKEAFYEKYGTKVLAENEYDADAFVVLLEELRDSVQNEALKADLQYVIDETRLAKVTHVMDHANNLYKALHDLDYFLLRYGPAIDEESTAWIKDKSTVSKYYGTLSIHSSTSER